MEQEEIEDLYLKSSICGTMNSIKILSYYATFRDVPKPKNQFRPKPIISFIYLPKPKTYLKLMNILKNKTILNIFYLLLKILKVQYFQAKV